MFLRCLNSVSNWNFGSSKHDLSKYGYRLKLNLFPHLLNSKIKVLFVIKTVSGPLSQRMARMDMDWNLEKLAQFYHVLMLCLQKSTKELLRLVLPGEICSISSS